MKRIHPKTLGVLAFLLSACQSAPAAKPETPAQARPEAIGRLLTEVDLYLVTWNNSILGDPNENRLKQVQGAEETIGRIVRERFDEFAAAMESADRRSRLIATASLGFCREPRALPYLVRALNQNDEEILGNALLSLGVLGSTDTPVASILEILSHHPNSTTRNDAAFALKRLVQAGCRQPSLSQNLRAALEDPEPGVRAQCAAALGHLQDKEAVDALIPLLKDSKPLIATAAAFALGNIRDTRPTAALIQSLESPNPRIREAAHRALVQIHGEDKGPNAWDWKQ